jgi:hypothetical protein
MVINEVCHADMYTFNKKDAKGVVNADKLKDIAELFASVRSDSRAFDDQPHDDVLPFLPEMNGDEYEAISGDEA